MDRTFHHRFSAQAFVAILLLAACALWCFLARTGLSPLVGLVCMLVGAAAVDRTIHTTYTFTAVGTLCISRGRLGGRLTLPVGDVISARKVRGTLFVAPHIVIEYGVGHITFAQPAQPDAFMAELRRRQEMEIQ